MAPFGLFNSSEEPITNKDLDKITREGGFKSGSNPKPNETQIKYKEATIKNPVMKAYNKEFGDSDSQSSETSRKKDL